MFLQKNKQLNIAASNLHCAQMFLFFDAVQV